MSSCRSQGGLRRSRVSKWEPVCAKARASGVSANGPPVCRTRRGSADRSMPLPQGLLLPTLLVCCAPYLSCQTAHETTCRAACGRARSIVIHVRCGSYFCRRTTTCVEAPPLASAKDTRGKRAWCACPERANMRGTRGRVSFLEVTLPHRGQTGRVPKAANHVSFTSGIGRIVTFREPGRRLESLWPCMIGHAVSCPAGPVRPARGRVARRPVRFPPDSAGTIGCCAAIILPSRLIRCWHRRLIWEATAIVNNGAIALIIARGRPIVQIPSLESCSSGLTQSSFAQRIKPGCATVSTSRRLSASGAGFVRWFCQLSSSSSFFLVYSSVAPRYRPLVHHHHYPRVSPRLQSYDLRLRLSTLYFQHAFVLP